MRVSISRHWLHGCTRARMRLPQAQKNTETSIPSKGRMRKTVSASVCSPVGDQAHARACQDIRFTTSGAVRNFSTLELLIKFQSTSEVRFDGKRMVGAYISPEQGKLLETVIPTLGIHDPQVLRYTFLEYTTHLGLISERVLGKIWTVTSILFQRQKKKKKRNYLLLWVCWGRFVLKKSLPAATATSVSESATAIGV